MQQIAGDALSLGVKAFIIIVVEISVRWQLCDLL